MLSRRSRSNPAATSVAVRGWVIELRARLTADELDAGRSRSHGSCSDSGCGRHQRPRSGGSCARRG